MTSKFPPRKLAFKAGLTLCLLAFFAAGAAQAQPSYKLEYVNSRTLIDKVPQWFKNEDYKIAADSLAKVHPSDSNYSEALLLRTRALIFAKEYKEAVGVARMGMRLPDSYSGDFYIFGLDALEKMDRHAEASAMVDSLIEAFPMDTRLYTYRISNRRDVNNFKGAYEAAPFAYEYNARYPNLHYHMGMMASKNDRPTEAILAFATCIMLRPESDIARLALIEMEKVARGNYTKVAKDSMYDGKEHNFGQLDDLIRAKLAMEPKYKLKVKADLQVLRQVQLVFEQVEYKKDDNGWYMQHVVPFIIELRKEKTGFTALAAVVVSPISTHSSVASFHKKNMPKAMDLNRRFTKKLEKEQKTNFDFLPMKGVALQPNVQGLYYAIGKLDDQGHRQGEWIYLYLNTNTIKSRGKTKDGTAIGEWKFYQANGVLSGITNYEPSGSGKRAGATTECYANGQPRTVFNYKNNMVNGTASFYYPTGSLDKSLTVKDGIVHGKKKEFYSNGARYTEYDVKNGKREGKVVLYHRNGQKRAEYNYKDDKMDGYYTEWHNNGQVSEKGRFVAGDAHGNREFFDEKGRLTKVLPFKKGLLDGKAIYYYSGTTVPYSEEIYVNGVMKEDRMFDEDGRLYSIVNFGSKHNVTRIQSGLKSDGTYSTNTTVKNSDIAVTLHYANGAKHSDGNLKKGMMEGQWRTYYKGGGLERIQEYKAGEKTGTKTEFYENGNRKEVTQYENGRANGYSVLYYPDGAMKAEGFYVNGTKQGEWRYYDVTGKLEQVDYLVNGSTNGLVRKYNANGRLVYEDWYINGTLVKETFYDSLQNELGALERIPGEYVTAVNNYAGTKRMEASVKNGLLNGPLVHYLPNGSKFSEINFKDGSRHGTATFYHTNGKVRETGEYMDGRLNGTWKTYYPDGILELESNYENGELTGKRTWYSPNGHVDYVVTYVEGRRDGHASRFDPSGEERIRFTYKRGKLVSYSYKDKEGTYVPEIPFTNGNAQMVAYYQNGQKSYEATWKNGDLEGRYLLFFPDGKTATEANYIAGERHGKYALYDPDGTLRIEAEYRNGQLHGNYVYHRGNSYYSSTYHSGDREGPTVYNQKGTIASTIYFVAGHAQY